MHYLQAGFTADGNRLTRGEIIQGRLLEKTLLPSLIYRALSMLISPVSAAEWK